MSEALKMGHQESAVVNMLNAVKAVLTEAGEPLHVTEITWSEPLIANHERSQLAPSAVCAASNSAGGR